MLQCKGTSFSCPAHEIHAQCFKAPWSEQEFTDLLNLPSSCLWMDEVSMLLCSHVADEMEILTIGVIPAERKKGKAQLLLTEMLKYATEKEVHHIFLEVSEKNKPAISLYEKMGFTQMGRRPKYYDQGQTDALTYQKVL